MAAKRPASSSSWIDAVVASPTTKIVLALAGVAVAATVVERALAPAARLQAGKWYRIEGRLSAARRNASVPPTGAEIVQGAATLRQDLTRAGFVSVPVVTTTPAGSWVMIGQMGAKAAPYEAISAKPSTLEPTSIREIAPPDLSADALRLQNELDPGLSDDEVVALVMGLDNRILTMSADQVDAFGKSFFPDFPLAGSLLRTRARIMRVAIRRRGSADIPAEITQKTAQAAPANVSRRPAGDHTNPVSISGAISGVSIHARAPQRAQHRARNHHSMGNAAWQRRRSAIGASILEIATLGGSDGLEWAADAIGDSLDLLYQMYEGTKDDLAPTEVKILDDALAGKNIPKSALARYSADTVRAAKTYQQFRYILVPLLAATGVGLGVIVAIEVGTAIALGNDMTDIAINTISLAIPGGPLAQAAFRVAATVTVKEVRGKPLDDATFAAIRNEVKAAAGDDAAIAYDIAVNTARGKPVDQATLDAIREVLRQYGGEDAAVAFDYGVSIAEGKELQLLNFPVVARYFGGMTKTEYAPYVEGVPPQASEVSALPIEQVDAFKQYVMKGEASGIPAVDLVLDDMRKSVGGMTRGDLEASLKPAIAALVDRPELAQVIPSQLAATLGIPVDVARLALAAVRDLPAEGGTIPNRRVLGALLPSAPFEVPLSRQLEMRPLGAKRGAIIPNEKQFDINQVISQIFAPGRTGGAALRAKYAADQQEALRKRKLWVTALQGAAGGRWDIHRIGVDATGAPVLP